jgi:hypothetical protein
MHMHHGCQKREVVAQQDRESRTPFTFSDFKDDLG